VSRVHSWKEQAAPRVVHLISGGDTGGAKTHVLLLVQALAEQIPVQLVCLTAGPFYRDAQKMGLPVTLLEQRRRWDLSAAGRLVGLLREVCADVLHCHGARANFLAALVRRRLRVHTVTTVHSDYKRDFEDNLYKHLVYTTLNTGSLRTFDHLIAVTQQFADMLSERGFSRERIFTVYNGLDFSHTPEADGRAFRRRWQIPFDSQLVGTVGRLARVKRHDLFLRAAADILRTRSDVYFAIVGDGEERDSLRTQAEELQISSRVIFTGHLDDVEEALSAFDINVLTSESESFPYALLEGARHALPTIATEVGGVPDLIRDGVTGLTLPAGEARPVRDALEDLLSSPKRRNALGENLREHACSQFSLQAMRDRHTEIYDTMLQQNAGTKSSREIIISGYFGFGNTGDEALLEGMIRGLRSKADNLKITVFSADPRATEREHSVRAVHRFAPLQVIGALRKADLFLSGGGTLLQDETSFRSLLYYSSLIHAARALGARIMIYANGLGPLHSRAGRYLARRSLKIADAVTLRDDDSLLTSQELRVGRPVQVTADPAFSLRPAPPGEGLRVLQQAGAPDGVPVAILSLRPWPGATGRVIRVMARTADFLHERGYYPLFYSMQRRLDARVCQAAADLTQHPSAVIDEEMSPSCALAVLSQASLTIGMRLHALILSASAGVPCLGISYDPKVDGFLTAIGQPCAGRVGEITEDEMTDILEELVLPRLPHWRNLVQTEAARLRRRAERNADIAVSLLAPD